MEKRSISSLSSPQPESLSKPDESAEMPNISSQECTSTISNLEIGGGAFTGESTDVQSGDDGFPKTQKGLVLFDKKNSYIYKNIFSTCF